MALSKEIVEDKIEVLTEGQLQIRTSTTVLEDSVVLSSAFSRKVVNPRFHNGSAWVDTDVSGESARVQAIAGAVWTDDTNALFEALPTS